MNTDENPKAEIRNSKEIRNPNGQRSLPRRNLVMAKAEQLARRLTRLAGSTRPAQSAIPPSPHSAMSAIALATAELRT
jgi:hypothetical protein